MAFISDDAHAFVRFAYGSCAGFFSTVLKGGKDGGVKGQNDENGKDEKGENDEQCGQDRHEEQDEKESGG